MSDQRFNTGNPIGSNSPLDRSDNTRNLDLAVNSSNAEWVDRLGQSRLTFAGMQSQFSLAQELRNSQFQIDQAERASEFDADQAERENDFDATQDDREQRFNAFIASSGYQFAGDYAPGIEITEYNQLVRDENGEFWRVSGQVDLPYVTTGSGIPEGDALVPAGDAVLRQDLANGTIDIAGATAAKVGDKAFQSATPAKLSNIKTLTAAPLPIALIDDLVWAYSGGTMQSSTDGVSWTNAMPTPWGGGPVVMIKTDDGEVLAATASTIYKSNGWPSNSTTWVAKVQASGANAVFTLGCLSGNGEKFIAGEYAVGTPGSGWEDSTLAWISTDMGDTWQVAFDSQELFPTTFQNTHIHAVCYDEPMDRFFVVEGHSPDGGIYWSDDLGTTWTRMEDDFASSIIGGKPVFLIPTSHGIVCGTDSSQQGIFLITRADDGKDMRLRWTYELNYGSQGLGVWAFSYDYDPLTDTVYFGCRAEPADGVNRACIIASDGIGSNVVWESDDVATSAYTVERIAVTPNRKLIWRTIGQATERFIADIPKAGALATAEIDTGAVMGGQRTGAIIGQSLAVGKRSKAGNYGVSVGVNAETSGERTVAIGRNSRASYSQSVAIGDSARAMNQSTCVGGGSSVDGGQSVAVGKGIDITFQQVTAIGDNTKSNGVHGTAVGYNANVKGAAGTAIGRNSVCQANSVAIGNLADADANPATAVGYLSKATAQSVALGNEADASVFAGTALGSQATSGGSGVAIGHLSSCNAQSVAVGRQSLASGADSVAVGRGSVASAPESTAFGRDASATTASRAMAIGKSASSTHADAIALGANTASLRASSVCIGARDFESTKSGGGFYLRSPDGTLYLVTVANSGTLSVSAV